MERLQIGPHMIEFNSHKSHVNALVKEGKYDEALARCDSLFAEMPISRAEILRLRAYVHAHRGTYEEAIADRESIISSDEGILRDYYQLADNLLSAGRYEDASKWFNEVLRKGADQNETWFDAAALLLLAYAQIRLGRLQDAEIALDKAVAIDPECAMPVRGDGLVTHQNLREEIQRRARGGGKRR